MTLTTGQDIAIATPFTAESVHGVITKETAKAVQVAFHTPKGKTITAWFPRKALPLRQGFEAHALTFVALASWFAVKDDWANRALILANGTEAF